MALNNHQPKNKSTNLAGQLAKPDFISSLQGVLEYVIKFNNTKKAWELAKSLAKAVAASKAELTANPELADFYEETLVKFKLIAFPLLDNEENIDLVKNYFTWQFHLSDYDLLEKLSGKLLNILALEDRDKLKADLRMALLNNNKMITERAEIRTIADWLKNYNAKLGIGIVDNLKRVEYLVGLTKVKGLDERYLNRLKTLFNFYEAVKLSSLTPIGFDEEPPIVIDGKLHIFRHGVLEPVGEAAIKPGAAEVKTINQAGKIARLAAGVNQPRAVSVKQPISNLEELKQMAATYSPGSFERKVVEEEIRKMTNDKFPMAN